MNNLKNGLIRNIKYVFGKIIKYDLLLFLFTIFLVVIGSVTLFTGSLILKIVIDNLEKGIKANEIIKLVIALSLIIIIPNLLKDIINNACMWRFDRFFNNALIDKNEKIMYMDYQVLENPNTQNMIKKADHAMAWWYGFGGIYFNSRYFWEAILAVITASIIVSLINPIMILFIILFVICKFFISDKCNKIDKERYLDVLPPYKRKSSYITALARNTEVAKDLRIYKMNEFIEKEQNAVNEFTHSKYKESVFRHFKVDSLLKILVIIEELMLYGFLIYEFLYNESNNMSIGTFTFMLTSIRTLSHCLSNTFNQYAKLRHFSRETDDLRFVTDKDTSNNIYTSLKETNEYVIEFKNVYFRYYKQENYALENVSFILRNNEKIALVGYNGAGKTTLIKLLCRLYTPESGEILINGVNINDYSKEDYFELIAPVFQDVNCFAFDIGCNVSMRHAKNTDYEFAYECLKLAGLEEKVKSLPLGIKTVLSKNLDINGTDFSGGEKQKLALARSIYKKSPIIILDEPTAALDALAEYELYQNFNKIINNKSAIYISHRLSSTRFCDRIILLENGRIIEEGTHEELMSKETKYKEIFSIQAQYYQDEEKK